MENYTVYKITSPSNKVYIGITKNIIRRFKEYKSLRCKSQILIYNSLKKYGWDSHIKEILFITLTKEEAIIKEKECVLVNKILNLSLNVSFGGEGANGLKFELSPLSKPIIQLSIDNKFIKKWSSLREASEKLGLSQGNISRAANGNNRSEGNYLWLKEEDFNKGITRTYEKNSQIIKSRKKILQYDKQGNLVKEWESIAEVCKNLKINKSVIHRILNNTTKNSKKYDFKYKCD